MRIIKFNKYEEKIEEITRSNEKCIVTMAKLKAITEELYFCKENDNFQVVSNKYINNVYKEYLDSTTYIGAVKDAADTWYAKWTCNSATANFGSASTSCTSLPTL